jgi:hypothetical protein
MNITSNFVVGYLIFYQSLEEGLEILYLLCSAGNIEKAFEDVIDSL